MSTDDLFPLRKGDKGGCIPIRSFLLVHPPKSPFGKGDFFRAHI